MDDDLAEVGIMVKGTKSKPDTLNTELRSPAKNARQTPGKAWWLAAERYLRLRRSKEPTP